MMSHPAWVCGLKQLVINRTDETEESHTLRGCVD